MKTQLIKTQDKFILLSDEEIVPYLKYDEKNRVTIVLHIPSNTIIECNGIGEMNGSKTIIYSDFLHGREVLYKECKKIIAGIPSLPEIDFSDDRLGDEGRKRIGWVDVEKLYPTNRKGSMWMPNVDELANQYRQEGFKSAQSLNEKQFSLEDMRTLFGKTLESVPTTESHTRMISDVEYRHFVMDELFNRIIQSLQQTVWNVEVEMDCVYQGKCVKERCLIHSCDEKQPKIIEGSIKIIKIIKIL